MKLQKLFLVTIFISLAQLSVAQSQEKIYSLLIMTFAKGIQWPIVPAGDKFIIGIMEYPPLAAELKGASLKTNINGKRIEIRELDNTENIQGCHILFIPAYKSKSCTTIINKFPTAPTLMISNKMNFARHGGCIDFVLVNGKLNYEINCKSIEQRGLKVSSNIKGMGIVLD